MPRKKAKKVKHKITSNLILDLYKHTKTLPDLEKQETIAENIPPFNRTENILKALHSQGGNVPVTQ